MAFIGTFIPSTTNALSLPTSSSFTSRPRPQLHSVPVKKCSPAHAPHMFFGFNLFPLADSVVLPQNDKANAENRRAEIEEKRQEYVWSFEVIGDSPMIEGIPKGELPSVGWIEGLIRTILRVISNNLAVRHANARDRLDDEKRQMVARLGSLAVYMFQKIATSSVQPSDVNDVVDQVSDLFGAEAEGKGCSFEEYRDLFRVYKPDMVANLDQFLRDDIFGWYRVAGPSPLHLRKLDVSVRDMFPELTDDILRGVPSFSGDSIAVAEQEGRLFYVDYKEFDGVPPGKFPDGTIKENFHLYAPTALMAVPKVLTNRTTLLPIAIRCGQGSGFPMYTPNESHTDSVTWLAAKCTVQVADAVMHEARYHLGRTHLLLDALICSAHRSLAPNHPLLKLLVCHFEGTHFINYLGSLRLSAPGGTMDQITAPQIETTAQLCADAIRDPFWFNDWMPDKEFALRGVLDAECLKYPFRDDALKLWGAIQEWVGAFVKAYYKSDQDVIADNELADWCKEASAPNAGNIKGVGDTGDGTIRTVEYLIRFISSVVYIASVQHSALNFPQGTLMQFVPAMPMAGFSPPPKTPKPFRNLDHWVEEMLPDLKIAQRQLNTAELLAAFQWTSLGEYGRDLNFAPDEVDDALERFRERLSQIGSEIQERNATERIAGLPAYNFLVPKNIPQSTNV